MKAPTAPALVACAVLALAPGPFAQLNNVQHVSIVTTQLSSSKAGYETFHVGVQFDNTMVEDVYALFGEPGANIVIPPAFQVAAPFGADTGPVRMPAQPPRPGSCDPRWHCCVHAPRPAPLCAC